MAKHKVEIVGINTNDIKILSNDEIKKLLIEYRNGNERCKEELIMGNLKLILSVIKSFASTPNSRLISLEIWSELYPKYFDKSLTVTGLLRLILTYSAT